MPEFLPAAHSVETRDEAPDMRTATDKRTGLVRVIVAILAVLAAAAFVAVGCPSYRDGIPGQLAQGRDEAESAARSGALALEFWQQERSTPALVSVQLSDARDEVIKAYKGIAELNTKDAVNVQRQQFLTNTMTRLIDTLNLARAGVEHRVPADRSREMQRALATAADSLANEYR
jgi:anti-sigma-K factor RskA